MVDLAQFLGPEFGHVVQSLRVVAFSIGILIGQSLYRQAYTENLTRRTPLH